MFKKQPPVGDGPTAIYQLRVRYAETDQMGVVHHANYFVWFEAARAEYCRKYGIDYSEMERQGMFLPVVEERCRHRAPAHYDEELEVEARVIEQTRRTLHIGYTVRRAQTILAEGETIQVLAGSDGRARTFPEELQSKFLGLAQNDISPTGEPV